MARTYPTTVTANSVTSSTKFNDETVLQLQHLLGFTLDGDDLDSITTPKELHTFKHRVAPSTPSSGNTELYVDSADDWMKIKQPSGAVHYWGDSAYTQKITLGSDGEFNITLSDYPEAAGATSMIIDFRVRSVTVATTQFLYMRFNGEIATTNYHRQTAGGADNAGLFGEGNDQVIALIPAASAPANQYERGQIHIYNLESGDCHISQILSGSLYGSGQVRNNNILATWNNTDAITSIQIRGIGSTDLISGCWIKLRFIKEAY